MKLFGQKSKQQWGKITGRIVPALTSLVPYGRGFQIVGGLETQRNIDRQTRIDNEYFAAFEANELSKARQKISQLFPSISSAQNTANLNSTSQSKNISSPNVSILVFIVIMIAAAFFLLRK